ncbi:DUF4783 domain-containing protein [Pontibacter sp. G13]|uniref:DUF4783 domain-containing protein n=1 Tax=Pontibacter sp. G13 TaxID=3074898 RepID=UPI00288BDA77|nr:DUF4783 domain-containing protein [Pontibacter sp. G13]WNJ17604.1 DUF4783 domain-containing protein [Pontibacter sp. G13]
MRFLSTITLLLVLFSFGLSKSYAQDGDDVLHEVWESMTAGDADRLAEQFDTRVEINLFGKSEEYTQAQAKYVMEQFFQDYPNSIFKILHKGNTDRTTYAVCEYTCDKGTFDVNVFIQQTANGGVLSEIRFEAR